MAVAGCYDPESAAQRVQTRRRL